MKHLFFKALSILNKTLLPKIYKKEDFARLNKVDWLIFGWKHWVTFRYLDTKTQKNTS
jgi:hypothetical protein